MISKSWIDQLYDTAEAHTEQGGNAEKDDGAAFA